MEPISVLLTALALGAKEALKPTVKQAVKDAYIGLKALIVRKFSGREPELGRRLADNEQHPEAYEKPTAVMLARVGADGDQEVVDLATVLLQLLEQEVPGVSGGLVGQINALGGKVVVVGGDVGNINL